MLGEEPKSFAKNWNKKEKENKENARDPVRKNQLEFLTPRLAKNVVESHDTPTNPDNNTVCD